VQTAAAGSTNDVATNLENLHKKVMGGAAAQADTLGGKFASLKAHMENLAESAGQKVGPIMAAVGPVMLGMGSIISSNLIPNLAKGVVSVVGWAASTVASAATAAAGWVADMAVMVASSIASAAAMIVPFLPLIATVAAIGVAAYLLYRNWDTVWGFIKQIAADAWRWITDHIQWIALAFGPLGIAADLLLTHWHGIWDGIQSAVQAVWDFLKRAFDDIVGIFRTAIDTITHLPGIGLLKDVLGGGASVLHTLHIPGFAAGGVVPGAAGVPMLAVVHGGETVTPAGRTGMSFGDVIIHINNPDPTATAVAVRDELVRLGRSNGTTPGL